eukprot:jgi/Bigna1/91284/estExt_fgenesh1_pg.C_950038
MAASSSPEEPWRPSDKILKIVASMGYSSGRGLGRSEQGRLEPVLGEQRPDKLGLGYKLPGKKAKMHVESRNNDEAQIRHRAREPNDVVPAPFLVRIGEERRNRMSEPCETSNCKELGINRTEKQKLKKKKKKKKRRRKEDPLSNIMTSSSSSSTTPSPGTKNPISSRETFPNDRKDYFVRPEPPDTPSDEVCKDGGEVILVESIPREWRSRDLRSYFSSWVEAGFFLMFHFRHRQSSAKLPRAAATTTTALSNVYGNRHRCCLVILRSSGVEAFLRFNGLPWRVTSGGDSHDRSGSSKYGSFRQLSSQCCRVRRIPLSSNLEKIPPATTLVQHLLSSRVRIRQQQHHLSNKERRIRALKTLQASKITGEGEMEEEEGLDEIEAAIRAGELSPPPGLPGGFVGTPSHILRLSAEREEGFPAGLLKRLGIVAEGGGGDAQGRSGKDKAAYGTAHHRRYRDKNFLWLYETHPLDDDDKIQRMRRVERANERNTPEEWDRHLGCDPILDQGRLLGKVNDERLFESKVDNPWDKHGAEGLVLYTDAVRWDAKKGDFDERTTDGWDVEGSLSKVEEEYKAAIVSTGKRAKDSQLSNQNRTRTLPKKKKKKEFVDGHLDDDYMPTTSFDREPDLLPSENQRIGSFKLQ